MKAWAEEWEWVAQRALEAMGNGLWQGLLAAGLIWLGFRFLPRLNAATRYATALAGMLLVAVLPLVQFAAAGRGLAGSIDAQTMTEVIVLPMEPAAVWEEGSAGNEALGPGAAQPELMPPFAAEFSGAAASERGLPIWNLLRKEWTVAAPALAVFALLAFWAAVSTVKLGRLAWQCVMLRAMKKSALAPSEPLLAEFHRLTESLRLPRRAHLGVAPKLSGPIAAGFFRPMVLVPASFEALAELPAGRARLEAVLRHELAHIARRDDWTNLLQQVLLAIYFFHPGVVWLGRRMSLEREIACDDHALGGIGRGSRKEYALLLTDFARQMQGPEWAAAPGAWGSEHQLKERIHMILDKNRNASTRLAGAKAGVLSLGALLVALLAMQAGPRLAVAEEAKNTSEPVTVSVTEPEEEEITKDIVIKTDGGRTVATIRSGGSSVSSTGSGGSGASSSITSKDPNALEVTSGPRKKTVEVSEIHAHPHPTPHAEPPRPPRPPKEGPADVMKPAHAPDAPKPPKPSRNQNEDLERRLERLERRLESLDKKEGWGPEVHFKKDFNFEFDEPKFREKMAKMDKDFKFEAEEMKRVQEHAQRAGELAWREAEKAGDIARREAEKAAEEVRRSVRDIERDGKVQREVRVEVRRQGAEHKARRKALEQQRRELEKQLQAVEREIEQTEREVEQQERERGSTDLKRRATEDNVKH